MHRPRFSAVLAIAIGIATALSSASGHRQGESPKTVGQFPDLVGGLRATPGCLGAETLVAKNGKQFVIVAWFKDKKAAETWYYSKMHTAAMSQFFSGTGTSTGRKPMGLIKDPNKPIMVIASVTPNENPLPGQKLAVSQIAIEMYTPLPGGLALGESFAPATLDVPGLVRLKPAGPSSHKPVKPNPQAKLR